MLVFGRRSRDWVLSGTFSRINNTDQTQSRTMTSQSPRIYIYKITFEEVPYYYYGVHKEKRYNEYYMGSPKTHKWCWNFYTPKKQILELFDFTDEGWIEAQEVEKRLIKPFYNTDKWCLNESCGGVISLQICSNAAKIGGKRTKELGVGVCGISPEQRSENGKISGKKSYELGVGIHGRTKEQMTEDGKIGGKITGKKHKENKTGIFGLTPEQKSENGRKGGKISGKLNGKKTYELGVGVHERTKEKMSEDGKKGAKNTNSQKWMCLETEYVTTAGPLTKYQKKRGIDTSKRVRLS